MELTRPTRSPHRASIKFKLPCQDYVSNEQTTQSWLTIEKLLHYTNDAAVAILQGSLNKTKQVVLKFGNSELITREYTITEHIYRTKTPNFIKFICMFTCNDRFSNVLHQNYASRPYVCDAKGDPLEQISAIVMPNYPIGSLNSYPWKTADLPALKNLLKQITFALLDAYTQSGFIHMDLHCSNVLIRKTKKTKVNYTHAELPIVGGKYAVIMDLERYVIHPDPDGLPVLYTSIKKIINLTCSAEASDLELSFDPIRCRVFAESPPVTKEVYDLLATSIDAISVRYLKSEVRARSRQLFHA